MQPLRTLRINCSKAGMHRFVPLLCRHALVFFPDGQIGLIPGKRAAFDQRVHIQARASGYDRHHPAGQDILRRSIRQLHIPRDRKSFARRTDIKQVMRHTLPFCYSRLRGADIHPAVDLHRVRRNDLGVQLLRKCDRQSGLAAGGRATDTDQAVFHSILLIG